MASGGIKVNSFAYIYLILEERHWVIICKKIAGQQELESDIGKVTISPFATLPKREADVCS